AAGRGGRVVDRRERRVRPRHSGDHRGGDDRRQRPPPRRVHRPRADRGRPTVARGARRGAGGPLSAPAESEVPLRRKRDFVLLQAGPLLSWAGTQSTASVYSLLALALSGSPATAGVVSFARAQAIVV